ncbi:MAG: sugar phosphate isomerase/epimerase family protein [Pseudomonadota bacterium]
MPAPLIRAFGASCDATGNNFDALDRSLARIEAAGATCAEIALFSCDSIVSGRVNRAVVRQLEAICGRRNLHYTVHGPLVSNFFDVKRTAMTMAVQKASVDITAALGTDVMVMRQGVLADEPDEATLTELLAAERDALIELGDYAAANGVTIAVENVMRYLPTIGYCAPPDRLAAHLSSIAHPNVRCTLEVGHAYLSAEQLGRTHLECMRPLGEHIVHIHCQDQYGRSPTMKTYTHHEAVAFGIGDLHLPMGWGDIDFDGLLLQLGLQPGITMFYELNPIQDAWLEQTLDRLGDLVDRLNAAASANAGEPHAH